MIALPQIFKLFPYPTLFRSCSSISPRVIRIASWRLILQWVQKAREGEIQGISLGPGKSPTHDSQWPLPQTRKDRKSTRLNSSHVKTSYAVFCLKKKIKATAG